ncbi:hypothetical protein C8C76_13230 [Halanaerobium saccharolyticum]|jgi:hypothetical protein|uniref:Uncharacterized protein n=1 Tax=Halanaerobium saccharolyticum TaxID=43595 RepID=A0A2T5RGZ3_9FIRM|nr:hypothetical protein C8C76_13230 [Halanaerobium saccharolyticum]
MFRASVKAPIGKVFSKPHTQFVMDHVFKF